MMPRVRFCWWCGRKLRGSSHAEIDVDGNKCVVHKQCAQLPDSVVRDDEAESRVLDVRKGMAIQSESED